MYGAKSTPMEEAMQNFPSRFSFTTAQTSQAMPWMLSVDDVLSFENRDPPTKR